MAEKEREEKKMKWDDKLVEEFAMIATAGSYGSYKDCPSLLAKIERFKFLKDAASGRTPEQIRDQSIDLFNSRAKAKFDAGQKEHAGNLDERVMFKDIEDEIIDLWFYVQSMKMKCDKKGKRK